MRIGLFFIGLILAGATAWVWFGMAGSYSDYSDQQLDTLEREYARVEAAGSGGEVREAQVSASILRDERHRRALMLPLPIATAAVLILWVALLFTGGGTTRRSKISDEEQRLLSKMGNPTQIEAGARNKAAVLLGVQVNAPAELVHAAYDAQLRVHDPARLEGLAPDLQHALRQKLADLARARDLLLSAQKKS